MRPSQRNQAVDSVEEEERYRRLPTRLRLVEVEAAINAEDEVSISSTSSMTCAARRPDK